MTAEHRKLALYFALAIILVFLYSAWQREFPTSPAQTTTEQTTSHSSDVPDISAVTASTAAASQINASTSVSAATGKIISVQTDLMTVKINTDGGNIVSADLSKYPVSLKDKAPIQLLDANPEKYYVAQSGLTGSQGPDTNKGQVTYTTQQTDYQLKNGENKLQVVLQYQDPQGLQVEKIFNFYRDNYLIDVNYKIANHGASAWTGHYYAQIRRKQPEEKHSFLLGLHTFTGAAVSTPEKTYDKFTFKDLKEDRINKTAKGGWLAMQQRYFLSAWVPTQNQTNHYYSSFQNDIATVGYVGPAIDVAPGQSAETSSQFYVGPEIAKRLKPIAPGLELTVDYGWLWFISVIIFWVMDHIHEFVGNWGWSIVITTLLIKLLFYKLSETSYRSMAKMRKLAPRMKALKDRYGDDKQKMSQATMALYKEEKVNPLSGCLPILVQIPFFIALYYVLIESIELRQAPFIFWIHDLSVRDPYFVLPILMGVSMFVQQRLNPAPPDPTQARIMMALPIIFTVFFAFFPAGLVLYWLVNNCTGVLQQWIILKRFEKDEKKAKLKN